MKCSFRKTSIGLGPEVYLEIIQGSTICSGIIGIASIARLFFNIHFLLLEIDNIILKFKMGNLKALELVKGTVCLISSD